MTEISSALKTLGVDIYEARVTCDGFNEVSKLVVRSRGKAEKFDDERIDEMRGSIEQIIGDKDTVVYFEDETLEFPEDGVLSVTAVGEVYRKGAANVVTAVLREMGLFVHQGEGTTSIQNIKGIRRRIGTGSWYCVNRNPNLQVDTALAEKIKLLLAEASYSAELKEWLFASFVVKTVDVRSVPPKAYYALIRHSTVLRTAHSRLEKWERKVTSSDPLVEEVPAIAPPIDLAAGATATTAAGGAAAALDGCGDGPKATVPSPAACGGASSANCVPRMNALCQRGGSACGHDGGQSSERRASVATVDACSASSSSSSNRSRLDEPEDDGVALATADLHGGAPPLAPSTADTQPTEPHPKPGERSGSPPSGGVAWHAAAAAAAAASATDDDLCDFNVGDFVRQLESQVSRRSRSSLSKRRNSSRLKGGAERLKRASADIFEAGINSFSLARTTTLDLPESNFFGRRGSPGGLRRPSTDGAASPGSSRHGSSPSNSCVREGGTRSPTSGGSPMARRPSRKMRFSANLEQPAHQPFAIATVPPSASILRTPGMAPSPAVACAPPPSEGASAGSSAPPPDTGGPAAREVVVRATCRQDSPATRRPPQPYTRHAMGDSPSPVPPTSPTPPTPPEQTGSLADAAPGLVEETRQKRKTSRSGPFGFNFLDFGRESARQPSVGAYPDRLAA